MAVGLGIIQYLCSQNSNMHHEETTTFWTLCPADGGMLLRGRPARVKACHPRRPIDTRGADGHQGTGTRDTDGEDLSRKILRGKDGHHRGWQHGRDRQEERGIPSLYHQDRIGHRRMELRGTRPCPRTRQLYLGVVPEEVLPHQAR